MKTNAAFRDTVMVTITVTAVDEPPHIHRWSATSVSVFDEVTGINDDDDAGANSHCAVGGLCGGRRGD